MSQRRRDAQKKAVLLAAARVGGLLNQLGLHALNRAGVALLERLIGRSFTVEARGITLQGAFNNWSLLHQFKDGKYEPFTIDLFESLVQPGMTVVDVGANIGMYSILAAKRVGDAGAVYAFEPDSQNQRDLLSNARRNSLRNVILVPRAASDKVGSLPFYVRRPAGHSSLHPTRGQVLAEHVVACVPVDQVVDEQPVDVVKIDAEGHEVSVLDGMTNVLRANPTVALIIEFAPDLLHAAGRSGGELLNRLRTQFDVIYEIDEQTRQLVRLKRAIPEQRCNLYCRRGLP